MKWNTILSVGIKLDRGECLNTTYSVCPSTVIFDSTELKSRPNKPYNFPNTTLSCLRVTLEVFMIAIHHNLTLLLLTKPIPSYLNTHTTHPRRPKTKVKERRKEEKFYGTFYFLYELLIRLKYR